MDSDDLRHICYRCGGSCQGPGAPVEDAGVSALVAHAAALGIPDPIADGRLRTIGGRCVFLQQDNLCALHLTWGEAAKPAYCRAFPRVTHGATTGLDPGCLTGFLTENEPFTDPLGGVLRDSIELALGRLVQAPAAPGTPPLPVAAWMTRALPDVLDAVLHASTAPGLRARLRHLALLRAAGAPRWPALPPATTAHALDVARRMAGLALVRRDPERVALDTLRGAALCAWADGSLHRFAPALAAWTRLQRAGPLLDVLDRPLDA
ncbi:MAG: YkgJ family cysteine cluster protein [Alphaproteobacteria bacterium]|nr:YkgJ family cysteine cluster protein [Alphaproteobacteria bacterium]